MIVSEPQGASDSVHVVLESIDCAVLVKNVPVEVERFIQTTNEWVGPIADGLLVKVS